MNTYREIYKGLYGRLIFDHGKQVGEEPAAHYVYLWTDADGTPRYPGRSGLPLRWKEHYDHAHIKRLEFPFKRQYFKKHRHEMQCWMIAEGISEAETADLEIQLTDRYGYAWEKRNPGLLVNAKRGSIVTTGRKKPPAFHIRLWRRVMREGQVAPNGVVERIIGYNPKKDHGNGIVSFSHENFDLYLPPGKRITVAKHNKKAFEADPPFSPSEQHDHLCYDATVGFIAIRLPKNRKLAPGFMVPTKELLHRLALEVGTEDEWQKHCVFRERQGGKVGG